ncbi:MAG: AraC family transcriptional regulator [Spirochaetaceae bacterium]|jgi:AraC-like DNA-binding protein|nr:AraC family transcriptional regulator [Spirochaetaceae bacterium]
MDCGWESEGREELLVPDIQYLVFRRCSADWRLKPHLVSNYDITYVVKGRARYTVGRTIHEVSPGTLLCIPEDTRKAAVTCPDELMHCYSVNVILTNAAGQKVTPPFPAVSSIGVKNDVIRLFNDLVGTRLERQPGYALKCQGLLILIIHRLLELTVYHTGAPGYDRRIQKATRFIARHYADRLTVKALALAAGLNPAYFGVLFKRVTGFTVNRYIAMTRVRNAKNLLQSGGCRVSEAADACGYCDVFHFYKQFKALTGVTPSQYLVKSGL